MAKPIKETPVLKGKDAAKFIAEMKLAASQSPDSKTRERIKENFKKLSSIAKF